MCTGGGAVSGSCERTTNSSSPSSTISFSLGPASNTSTKMAANASCLHQNESASDSRVSPLLMTSLALKIERNANDFRSRMTDDRNATTAGYTTTSRCHFKNNDNNNTSSSRPFQMSTVDVAATANIDEWFVTSRPSFVSILPSSESPGIAPDFYRGHSPFVGESRLCIGQEAMIAQH